MALNKRISGGDYSLQTITPNANVSITTHTVLINGNLSVSGNTTTIVTTDMNVKDNIIVLNSGETAAGVTKGTAGVEVDRGLLTDVGIRWNEPLLRWELTKDGVSYSEITTGVSTGIGSVVEDTSPQLGGNLEITGRTIWDNTANVTVNAGTVSSGGSGLYVSNSGGGNQELITKAKAIIYALIM